MRLAESPLSPLEGTIEAREGPTEWFRLSRVDGCRYHSSADAPLRVAFRLRRLTPPGAQSERRPHFLAARRMKGEIDREDEKLGRKLRYLFWLN